MIIPAPDDPAEIQDYLWKGAKGDVAWDVGANVGQSIRRLLGYGFTKVVAFEPAAESFAELERAGWDPAQVELRNEAASDHEGILETAIREAPIGSGQLVATGMPYHGEHVGEVPAMADWGADAGTREVMCVTLDAVAAERGMPDFVKVDTEGHEGQVLRGASSLLASGGVSWLIEFHSRELHGECMALLGDAGYEAETVRHAHYPPGSHMWYHHGWIKAPAQKKEQARPGKLNLGCGGHLAEGFTGVDLVEMPGVDVVHDLDVLPWPFGDASCDEIIASDIFEHVNDPIGFMTECGRVLEKGGVLRIRTNYWQSSNAFCDPTHKRFCTEKTFDYWCPDTEFGQKYGAAYARGVGFRKMLVQLRGQELVVILERL